MFGLTHVSTLFPRNLIKNVGYRLFIKWVPFAKLHVGLLFSCTLNVYNVRRSRFYFKPAFIDHLRPKKKKSSSIL